MICYKNNVLLSIRLPLLFPLFFFHLIITFWTTVKMSSGWYHITREADSDSETGSDFSEWSKVSVAVDGSGNERNEGTTVTPSLLDGDVLGAEPGQNEPEAPVEPSAEYLLAES